MVIVPPRVGSGEVLGQAAKRSTKRSTPKVSWVSGPALGPSARSPCCHHDFANYDTNTTQNPLAWKTKLPTEITRDGRPITVWDLRPAHDEAGEPSRYMSEGIMPSSATSLKSLNSNPVNRVAEAFNPAGA